MNKITQPVSPPVQAKPVTVSSAKVADSGNTLPHSAQAAKVEQQNVQKFQEHVEAVVAQMNEYIQSTQRDLHFSYDRDSGETVVKVLDRSTQQVIRQIPDETFLKLAQNKDSMGSLQLLSAQA